MQVSLSFTADIILGLKTFFPDDSCIFLREGLVVSWYRTPQSRLISLGISSVFLSGDLWLDAASMLIYQRCFAINKNLFSLFLF